MNIKAFSKLNYNFFYKKKKIIMSKPWKEEPYIFNNFQLIASPWNRMITEFVYKWFT